MGYIVLFLILAIAVILLLYLRKSRTSAQLKSGSASAGLNLKNTDVFNSLKKEVQSTPAKAFKKEMRTLNSQIERMDNKLDTLDRSLKNYFGDSVISYQKFAGTIGMAENVFADNTRKLLKRIDVFDEEGYSDIYRKHLEYTDAIKPYQSHFTYVTERLAENEEILGRLDKLLLEINNLNESSIPIDQLPAMQEINELIEQTRLYKQAQGGN